MTITELHDQLAAIVATDEYAADMQIRFGPEMMPVQGGIITKDAAGLVVLSLAPMKLDFVGGF